MNTTPSILPEDQSWAKIRAFAKRMDVCERTVTNWLRAEALVYIRVGRVVRIHVQQSIERLKEGGYLS